MKNEFSANCYAIRVFSGSTQYFGVILSIYDFNLISTYYFNL